MDPIESDVPEEDIRHFMDRVNAQRKLIAALVEAAEALLDDTHYIGEAPNEERNRARLDAALAAFKNKETEA